MPQSRDALKSDGKDQGIASSATRIRTPRDKTASGKPSLPASKPLALFASASPALDHQEEQESITLLEVAQLPTRLGAAIVSTKAPAPMAYAEPDHVSAASARVSRASPDTGMRTRTRMAALVETTPR